MGICPLAPVLRDGLEQAAMVRGIALETYQYPRNHSVHAANFI
jgi:hypothetical protein